MVSTFSQLLKGKQGRLALAESSLIWFGAKSWIPILVRDFEMFDRLLTLPIPICTSLNRHWHSHYALHSLVYTESKACRSTGLHRKSPLIDCKAFWDLSFKPPPESRGLSVFCHDHFCISVCTLARSI